MFLLKAGHKEAVEGDDRGHGDTREEGAAEGDTALDKTTPLEKKHSQDSEADTSKTISRPFLLLSVGLIHSECDLS